MQCCARTKEKWKRCSKQGKFIFCEDHKRGWWFRVFVFIFITIPSCYLLYKGLYTDFTYISNSPVIKKTSPIFDSTDNRFKILILPFNKECPYQNGKYDIGFVINNRLQEMSRVDSLFLNTYYLNDTTGLNLVNITPEIADSLMKYHYANQIIYGVYTLKECESDNTDKVCFNYRTDTKKWKLSENTIKDDYDMTPMIGLESIRNGSGQERIDYVIYYMAALTATKKSDFQKAIKLYSKIENFENNATLTYNIGVNYSFLEDYISAIHYLRKSCSINPKDKNTWTYLGNLYASSSNDIIKVNFSNDSSVYRINKNKSKSADYEKTKICYEKALELAPGDDVCLTNLATAYHRYNDHERSISLRMKAINISPKNAVHWNGLGNSYMALKEYKKAQEAFRKAISLDSNFWIATLHLGRSYHFTNDFVIARNYYIKTTQIHPNAYKAWLYLAELSRYSFKDTIFAHQCYQKAYNINPMDLSVLKSFGDFYLSIRQYQLALQHFKKAVEVDPTDYDAWLLMSATYHAQGDNLRAIDNLESALKLSPNDYRGYVDLGSYYLEIKNKVKSSNNFFKAVQRDTTKYLALYQIAIAYSRVGEKNIAISYLGQAIKKNKSVKYLARLNSVFKWLWSDKDFISVTE